MPPSMCSVPEFFAVGRGGITFECGSSWEVDLRADADCGPAGGGRCHPRYTLGARSREVQLFRGESELPVGAEYAHAYCDMWGVGRVENVHMAPRERAGAREAALRIHRDMGPPPPPPEAGPEAGPAGCYSGDGSVYDGTVSVTLSGRQCQAWSSSFPHHHRWGSAGFPANHCRNPDGESGPWCYTTDPSRRFELCDVPRCEVPEAQVGAHALSVLLLVVRGVSAYRARALLPDTLAALDSLGDGLHSGGVGRSPPPHPAPEAGARAAGGSHEVVAFEGHRAMGGHGALRALFMGAPALSRPNVGARTQIPGADRAPGAVGGGDAAGLHGRGRRSLWQAFRRFGYVSSFSEAECYGAGAAAAGISESGGTAGDQAVDDDTTGGQSDESLGGTAGSDGAPGATRHGAGASRGARAGLRGAGSEPEATGSPDHVAVEPFCALDFQLRTRAGRGAERAGSGTGGGRGLKGPRGGRGHRWESADGYFGGAWIGRNRSGSRRLWASGGRSPSLHSPTGAPHRLVASLPQGAASCLGQFPALSHTINYTRAFLTTPHLYGALPKLAVAVLPLAPPRAVRRADGAVADLILAAVRARPNTAVVLLSDAGAPPPRGQCGGGWGALPARPREVGGAAAGEAGAGCALREAVPLLMFAVPRSATGAGSSGSTGGRRSGNGTRDGGIGSAQPSALRSNSDSVAPVSLLDVHATLRHMARGGTAVAASAGEGQRRAAGASAGVAGSAAAAILVARAAAAGAASGAGTQGAETVAVTTRVVAATSVDAERARRDGLARITGLAAATPDGLAALQQAALGDAARRSERWRGAMVGFGGASLLEPMASGRLCADASIPWSLCVPPALLRAAQRGRDASTPSAAHHAHADAADLDPSSATRPAASALQADNANGAAGSLDRRDGLTRGAAPHRIAPALAPLQAVDKASSLTTVDSLPGAAIRRFICALDSARARLARSRAAPDTDRRRAAGTPRQGPRPACRLPPARPNNSLLAAARAVSDVVGCDAPRFARIINGSSPHGARLVLDCPGWRMPYYALGLSAQLHIYRGGAVPLPRHVECAPPPAKRRSLYLAMPNNRPPGPALAFAHGPETRHAAVVERSFPPPPLAFLFLYAPIVADHPSARL